MGYRAACMGSARASRAVPCAPRGTPGVHRHSERLGSPRVFREGAEYGTRGACAPQPRHPAFSALIPSLRRLLQNPPKSPPAEHVIRERCDFLNPCGGVLQEPLLISERSHQYFRRRLGGEAPVCRIEHLFQAGKSVHEHRDRRTHQERWQAAGARRSRSHPPAGICASSCLIGRTGAHYVSPRD